MEANTLEITNTAEKDGWIIWNVASIGVNVKKIGKTGENTAWITLVMPTDKVLPVARQSSGTSPRPEGTLPFEEIKATFTALLGQAEQALTESEAGW